MMEICMRSIWLDL